MKTNMMINNKINIVRGIQIMSMGALLFGATAMIPAQAEDWHRDRDRGQVRIDVGFNGGRVDTNLRFNGDRDRRDEDRFHRDRDDRHRDDHDRDWHRDRR